MQAPPTIIPQWIAKMYAAKSGLDHMGLGSVSSDQILPSLSPGINVLTIHPRYYSFYTFLLDAFWQRDLPRSRSAWVQFYRPRAFIFSLGANLCDQPEHREMGSIVGSNTTSALAAEQRATYDTTTNYIKSDLGGYGLYYRSVIAELGLIYPGGAGFQYPVDVPSEQGKKVAAAFRQAIQHTTYYHEYFDKDVADVPLDVIRAYIRHACMCQLQIETAPDHTLLLDTFLHGGPHPEPRRATLRLFLDIADQTQGYALDEDAFRQLLYFQAADNAATYTPQAAIAETYRRWRLYQAREYYAFALNALWIYLCYWGTANSGDDHPIPLSNLWQHVNGALDFAPLAQHLDLPDPNLTASSSVRSLLDWLMHLVGTTEASDFDTACGLWAPLHEHCLYQLALENQPAPDVMIAGMVTMLVLIYLRLGQPDLWLTPEWDISRMGSDGRLSVDAFVKTLRYRLRNTPLTLGELARWLYADYVILQHQLVATGKLPDNTFRFRREGDRLRFFAHKNPLGFMDSRFRALSTTVYELGLCGDFGQPDHRLTSTGARLLAEGDLL